MGVASQAKRADVRCDTPWITVGKYGLLEINGLKEIDQPGKLLFIANMYVLESAGDEAIEAGMDTGYCVDCLKFKGSLAGDVLKFLSALTKTPVDEIDEDGIAATLTTDQPCVGMLIKCRAWAHTTSNNRVITKCKFFPATEEDVKRAGGLRKKLGMAPLVMTA